MLVNKLCIGCSVACAQGNKQTDSGASLCYFCSGDADLFSCECIFQNILHLKAYFLTSGKFLPIK